MTRTKKIVLTVCLTMAGMFSVAIWSESTATAIFGRASLEETRSVLGKKDRPAARQLGREVGNASSSLSAITHYSIGIAVLSFTAVVMLWLPIGSAAKHEPNQSSEPTPTSVTPRADARVAPAAVAAHL